MNAAPLVCLHVAVSLVFQLAEDEERPSMGWPTPQPAAIRHAYGACGAAPLCGEPTWRQVAPDNEVNCQACLGVLSGKKGATRGENVRRASICPMRPESANTVGLSLPGKGESLAANGGGSHVGEKFFAIPLPARRRTQVSSTLADDSPSSQPAASILILQCIPR
jgi:hypothetical protein